MGGFPRPYRSQQQRRYGDDDPDENARYRIRVPLSLLTNRVKEPTTSAVESEKRTERVVAVIQNAPLTKNQKLKQKNLNPRHRAGGVMGEAHGVGGAAWVAERREVA